MARNQPSYLEGVTHDRTLEEWIFVEELKEMYKGIGDDLEDAEKLRNAINEVLRFSLTYDEWNTWLDDMKIVTRPVEGKDYTRYKNYLFFPSECGGIDIKKDVYGQVVHNVIDEQLAQEWVDNY